MIINVLDLQLFNSASKVVSKDATRRYLIGVHIAPDGRITGTDGHMLIAGQGVNKFEGEAFMIKLQKTLPVAAKQACIDTERREISLWNRKDEPIESIPFTTIDANFPDYSRVIPEKDRERQGIGSIGVDCEVMLKLLKALPKDSVLKLQFGNSSSDTIRVICTNLLGADIVFMPSRFVSNSK